jgi:predicted alpha/beta hydrolase family esterase
MKKVFIIHGYTGRPDKNWFPWLKSELEKLGVQATALTMPNAAEPKLSEWFPHLQSQIASPDADTYFVGHSLGCIAILRYLESLPANVVTGGAVFVAGFANTIHIQLLNNFFQTTLNDEKIKKNIKKIVAINSDNDPHVPYELAEDIKKRFGAELIKVEGGLHLNEKAGYKEFPLVLKKLKEVMGL